jgi:hypothetical protein
MKKTLKTKLPAWQAILAFVIMAAVGCSGNRQDTDTQATEDVEETEWPAMDEFHMLMAESFHPFKDSANLEPAKLNAAAMAASASQWLQTSIPKQVDTEEVRDKLKTLSEATAEFVETVQSSNDELIAGELEAIHDIFHELQEVWYSHTSGHEDH